MSTLYVRSVKTHTLSLFTNTKAYFTASIMSNSKEDNTLDQNQREEGNSTIPLIASNAHINKDTGNSCKLYIKYIYFRADKTSNYLTTYPFLEGEDTITSVDMEEDEVEEELSVDSSSLLRSPEVRVPSQTIPRVPGTPTKEEGAPRLITPEKFGTPASSSKVSEVRRDLAKNMNVTGSVARRREERREAAEERRKEARDRHLGRTLSLPDSSSPRQRHNSAPSLLNAADPHDSIRDNTASDVRSRHPVGEGDRTDPSAPGGQYDAFSAPGATSGEPNAAATETLANEGSHTNRSLPPTPQTLKVSEAVTQGNTANEKTKKPGRRADRRSKRGKNKKKTAPVGSEQGSGGAGPSGVQHPDDVFAMPSPVATLTITREEAGSDGLALVAQTLFQLPVDYNLTNPIRPIPDGAMFDVCDQTSADAIAEELRRYGWQVAINPIWPRYEFVAPALLAGSGPGRRTSRALSRSIDLDYRSRADNTRQGFWARPGFVAFCQLGLGGSEG